jgi:hypothetical protein
MSNLSLFTYTPILLREAQVSSHFSLTSKKLDCFIRKKRILKLELSNLIEKMLEWFLQLKNKDPMNIREVIYFTPYLVI